MNSNDYGKAYAKCFTKTKMAICRRGISAAEAEEIAQHAWVKGWERIEQLQNSDDICAWIGKIAFNLLRDRFRKAQKMKMITITETMVVVESGVSLITSIRMDQILSYCTPKDRKLISLRLQGHSEEELAKILKVKKRTAKMQVHRLKKKIIASMSGETKSPANFKKKR